MTLSLRERLTQNSSVLAPGVFDPLTALLVEQAGFSAAYVSGASLSYTQLGRPDLGLFTLSQLVDAVSRMRDRTQISLIVDADTGFGNALNVVHTVRMLERAGAAAIQLEDQNLPKRCGHLKGKSLVSQAEMVGKIHAALDTRSSTETLVIARTDAIAVQGFDQALERAHAYREAGADVLFIEAPRSFDEMRAIANQFAGHVPLLANMVEGGRTPVRSATELEEIGFRLVITPGSLVRAMTFAAIDMLRVLKEDGSTAAVRDRMLDFAGVNAVLGLEELTASGERYASDVEPMQAAE